MRGVGMIEQTELKAQQAHLIRDVKAVVEKYRAIFDWNVPDIDQAAADRLILSEVRSAVDNIETALNVNRS
jgi:hypothetical protein